MNTILEILVAIGTIAVAILAIWGDWFRDKLANPKLILKLKSRRGSLTHRQDSKKALYYHLVVANKRKWALAKGVQIMINSIWRKVADGAYKSERMVADLPLTWAYPQFNPLNPSIRDDKTCDFGFLTEGSPEFQPSLYFYPNNFNGFIKSGESVRFGIGIEAYNFTSDNMILVEVSWDGNFTTNLDEMENHLVVKQIDKDDVEDL